MSVSLISDDGLLHLIPPLHSAQELTCFFLCVSLSLAGPQGLCVGRRPSAEPSPRAGQTTAGESAYEGPVQPSQSRPHHPTRPEGQPVSFPSVFLSSPRAVEVSVGGVGVLRLRHYGKGGWLHGSLHIKTRKPTPAHSWEFVRGM